MEKWTLELGIVNCWDDIILDYVQRNVSIIYDPDNDMKVTIISADDRSKTVTCSLDLKVEILDSGKVEMCNDIYLLTPEQFEMLNSVKEYWHINNNNLATFNFKEKLVSWEKHLGLVLYYDIETHKFELTDLDITYDMNAENEVELQMKTFNSETRIAEKTIKSMSEAFRFKFVSRENDLKLYKICNNRYLLNDHQAQIIDSLELYRKEDYDDE